MPKRRIFTLTLVIASITAIVSSTHAQSRHSSSPRLADSGVPNLQSAEGSPVALNRDTSTELADFLVGIQDGNRPAAVAFKAVPGDKTGRVAEFTTPRGLRMRAYTNSPDSIRFTPETPQPQAPDDIYIHIPRIVEALFGAGKTSGSGTQVGASVDTFRGVLGSIVDALGALVGRKVSKCSETVTITIDEDGKTTTTVVFKCTKS